MSAPAELERVRVPLEQLREHPKNPRRISAAALDRLARNLEADPQMLDARPLIALPDGTVIAGNQRLAAARQLGWSDVPVVYADLDEARAREWMLRDNRGFGEDDDELLAEHLRELADAGRDLEHTGFDSASVDRLLASVVRPAVDPDAVPDPPAKPRSKLGEVYELGPHRLMCGDATDDSHVASLTGGELVDVVVTDPPYGVTYQGGAQAFSARNGKRRVRTVDGDRNAELYALTLPAMRRVLRPDGALYLWFSDSRSAEVLPAVDAAGFHRRAVIIWAKDVPTGSLIAHYIPRHEPLLYASSSAKAPRWFGPTNEVTIWDHPKPRVNDLHPTQKPVALIERAITNSTRRGETVLDLFAGSGTTLIAASALSRRALVMELLPELCDVIRQRYADFTGEQQWAP